MLDRRGLAAVARYPKRNLDKNLPQKRMHNAPQPQEQVFVQISLGLSLKPKNEQGKKEASRPAQRGATESSNVAIQLGVSCKQARNRPATEPAKGAARSNAGIQLGTSCQQARIRPATEPASEPANVGIQLGDSFMQARKRTSKRTSKCSHPAWG